MVARLFHEVLGAVVGHALKFLFLLSRFRQYYLASTSLDPRTIRFLDLSKVRALYELVALANAGKKVLLLGDDLANL